MKGFLHKSKGPVDLMDLMSDFSELCTCRNEKTDSNFEESTAASVLREPFA